MLEFGLTNRVALVAGAGLGMGEATALGLAEAGCKVACLDLLPDRAQAVAERVRLLGVESMVVTADIRQRDQVQSAVNKVISNWGRLDAVADIVGQARWAPMLEVTDEDWDWAFDMNLRHQFLLTQASARQMVAQGAGGAFVAVSSISGLVGAEQHGPYGSAKAGLIALTKTLGAELGLHGIRFNSIAPSGIATPRALQSDTDVRRQAIITRTPLRRRGTVEEIAKVAVFLLSDLASYITGQTIVVDGGATVKFPI